MDIDKLKGGDAEAFKALMEAHQHKVFNTALSMLQHHEAAEDVTQEIFIEVFQSLPGFNELSNISTWIYRIAVNKCLDHLRFGKRQKRFAFLTSLFHSESGEPLNEVSHFDHPGVIAEKRESARYLFMAIGELPPGQKTAFILSQVEGLAQKEVAAIMELSVKAVESLLQRAKANLRGKLGNIYDGREGNREY